MSKKKREIEVLSPEQEVKVAFAMVISPHLNEIADDFVVEIKNNKAVKDFLMPPVFFAGNVDLVRSRLHSVVDEMFERFELNLDSQRRKEIKKVHPTDGKPLVWNPK